MKKGVFDYRVKKKKTILIVAAVMALVLIVLELRTGSRSSNWLVLGLFWVVFGGRMIWELMIYKNSKIAITAEAIEATDWLKKTTRIGFDEITSVKVFEELGRWTWGEVRSKDSRIAIIREIRDWTRLKSILEGLRPSLALVENSIFAHLEV